ncbi:hypothetical protein [Pedobacter psychroterrae]|uniref:Lipoprotein n=1 Tax=Pedobacter psychroterrae TaxID=2530453 RepID=A0A4R0NJY5_9SPHI|nr:hypothetical protein [Pedobacter psychroterrae]TCD00529.1 hypothetical protein EZ437_15020 [Pedobacter psychroterrae]
MKLNSKVGLLIVLCLLGASCVQKPRADDCKSGQELVYENAGFSSYTEDRIRAAGVVTFQLELNGMLTIYDLDTAVFGEVVRNEDGSYFTVNLPQKIVARWIVPQDDFSSFHFDAEAVDSSSDYLEIYVNSAKRLVKKDQVTYTFSPWTEYLKSSSIKLKACNLLKNADGESLASSKDQIFEVLAVKGDLIQIKSSKECLPDGTSFRELEGWLKWKSGDDLLIDFASCD